MKAKPQPETILKQIAQIQCMERGKLCRMRPSAAGAYYNHQSWEKGRNVVRYVAQEKLENIQKAIVGYQHYQKLTKAYADAIVQRTRQQKPTQPLTASTRKTSKPKKH